ncbi:hypothetical protein M3P05_06280 [Sansalvadorimonas sp. 2012CJ34-2]|uniref:Negative regulator of flagellin synthesis n=1 Tax=Parendozoicomonas callyspongiae TaxID=2942213 RepID=A0ABT0PDW4_9GAMM|nr:hypothetical protein [Sansalvadorimonas sp. 2012CJ34-2]MCL6269547.1 hypothetical protein [Sansalvadorimonas sp. 2012CJ34-2]
MAIYSLPSAIVQRISASTPTNSVTRDTETAQIPKTENTTAQAATEKTELTVQLQKLRTMTDIDPARVEQARNSLDLPDAASSKVIASELLTNVIDSGHHS